MEPHRLVLGRFDTRCTAIAGAEAAEAIGARLDRTIREDLPAALEAAAAPVLDGHEGVLRLRSLRIQLDLGDRVEAPGLARILAERIAAALKVAMAGGTTAGLRHWPDHESYLAAYILMRTGLVAEPAWAFPDLAVLQHLPAERAAAELIRAQPAVLAALARAAGEHGDPAAPLIGWPPDARAALARALIAPPLDPLAIAHLLPALRRMLTAPPSPVAHRLAAEILGGTLDLAMRLLAMEALNLAPPAVVVAAAAVLAARARRAESPAGEPDETNSAVPDIVADDDQAMLARAERLVAADGNRRDLLRRLARMRHEKAPPVAAGSEPTQRPEAPTALPAADGALRSQWMGLALLLPPALLLDAAAHLGPTALAQAVWQALDPADWPEAALDPALQVLLPVDPREVDPNAVQPEPAERLLSNIALAARQVYDASDPARRWTALLLADFASRLRGLHGSSHGYLRRQFLARPGEVRPTGDSLIVRLDRVPLDIVLRMAGLAGAYGRLPQPGRPRLIIELGDAA